MSRHQTFSKLVQSQQDFVGMVAYTIYKNEKINWIEAFKSHNSREPSAAEVEQGFNVDSDSDFKISHYRSLADSLLNDFIDSSIGEELRIYQDSLKEQAIIKTIQRPLWKSVSENVLSNLIAALIVAGVALVVWLFQAKDNPVFQKEAARQVEQVIKN